MARFRPTRWSAPLLLLLVFAGAPADAQQKPTVPASDYGRWEQLGSSVLSPDGGWLAYGIARVDGTSELRLRALEQGAREQVFEWGSSPSFAAGSESIAWRIGQSEEERERLAAAGEPVQNGVGLLELGAEEVRTFEAVASFGFDATGRYLALLGYAPREPEGKGADLRVLDLQSDAAITFGNVAEYRWGEQGSLLAFAVATGRDEGNGVQLYDPAAGTLVVLDSSSSSYSGLAWREEADDLAVYRSAAPASDDDPARQVLAWRGLSGTRRDSVLVAADARVAAGLQVVSHRGLQWSDDGTSIAIGLRPAETATEEEPTETGSPSEQAPPEEEGGDEPDETAAQAEEETEPELPGVQIWHTGDVRLYAAQKVAQQRDERRTLLAVWHLDTQRVVQIGSDLMERANLLEGWRRGVERVAAPYPWGAKFGRPYHDVWLIDAGTGERELALEKVRYSYDSAGGDYLLSFDGADYHSYAVDSGERRNLTADLPAEFERADWDTPTDMLPPWGLGGWLAGDAAVLLYDEFDIWSVAPDGSGATRMTAGADSQLSHRVTRLDPTEFSEPLDPAEPIYLALRNERTEQRGYARTRAGAAAEVLVLEDSLLIGLRRAEDADVLLYRAEARDDSPDLFVAGADLSDARQVTATNPWQDDYAWTRAELVDFESEGGRDLQAALLYPAGYEPGRRYPMIVYTYEILAPQIHRYEVPSERDYYNFTAWTQHGYFVLMPDIVYPWREPGRGAIESVRAAVKATVDRGLVDEDRVGLIGHSWGGWQAAYLPTRVDTFAASVSGAPLTDFVSFMGQMHWGPGIAELSHWETGQARMEVPYWEDPDAHHRSSPIHAITDLETPVLMAHGDADGVVEFFQSILYYNYARRADKQMVLLVYEGEDHGFRNEANQIDYHRRILEWFGHYLKGDPAPTWITEGLPLAEQEDEKRRVARGAESQ